jgi:hypothetical protein
MTSAGFDDRRRRFAAVMIAAAALVAFTAGCGRSAYTYVSNTDDRTYFKVPSGWSEADVEPVDDYFAHSLLNVQPDSAARTQVDRLLWSTAYDASDEPTGSHLVTRSPTSHPIVYSFVLHLPESLRGMVSLDYLRNIFLPVTDQVRAAAAEENGGSDSGFELLRDDVLTPADGIRGVRVVYNYRLALMAGDPGTVHTMDLTAHANNDSSVIYLLLIRCTASCYQERAAELDEIATSFTVRSE